MKNSQIAETLRSLSKSEFREFGKFVRSPYFNNRSEVIRLFDAIKRFFPQFTSKGFSEEKVFQYVYPGKKYSDVLMRKVVSLMTKAIADFYAVSSFKDNPLEYNVKLLYKLHEKKLQVMFDKTAKNTDELLNNAKHTFGYYDSKFKYISILLGHFQDINEKKTVYKLQEEIDAFAEYFLSVLLLLYARLSTWSRQYKIKYDFKFYNEALGFIEAGNFEEVTLVSLYYNMLMLLNTEEEKYFFELLKCSERFKDKLNDSERHNVYVILAKYCIARVEKGDVEFSKQHFNITKIFLKRNLFPKEFGYIEPYFFTSIIRNASDNKEFKWAEEFIADYKHHLDPGLRDEIINYSLAIVEFNKKNYEKSMKHLSTLNPERLNMRLNVKNLFIMIYYELNYTEELISSIDAYKHFLRRDKDTSERLKHRDTDFLRFVSALLRIKLNEKSDNAVKLMKEIRNTPYFNLKDWLLKKAGELIK